MAQAKEKKLYVGVDVGGTKILAALVRPDGRVLARRRIATPLNAPPPVVVRAIAGAVEEALADAGAAKGDLAAVGLAIPGVVDPDAGRVAITPNMNLSGADIGKAARKALGVPVALGNDVNLGTLGEKWLGAARQAHSAVGIFVGTGIGGGVFLDGKVHRGWRESAGEIGHLVMAIGGPKCGCGARGCFEAIASRSAMDRDIRAAIAAGRKSVVSDLVDLDDENSLIKSGVLRRALAAKDKVVTKVMRKAAEVMGHACLSIRHLIDPEVLVFGGGVVEACGYFLLPIIDEIVLSDPLTGARPGGRIVESALGDDAVALGAVALAQQSAGRDPFRLARARPDWYPGIKAKGPNRVVIAGETYDTGIYVRADGKVRPWDRSKGRRPDRIDPDTLGRICRGSPSVLFVASGKGKTVKPDPEAEPILHYRHVELRRLPEAEAIDAYNACRGTKAILLPLGG